jgi:uncharacterized membrane protein
MSSRRLWLWPVVLLAAVSLTLFAGFYLADSDHGVGGYFHFQSDMITDALPSLAAMIAAVLGIVITVVSIIVQLSSERYTGVAQMFLRDKVNVAVMAYFVVACVCGVWLSMAVKSTFVPQVAIVAMLVFTTLGLVVMLPYFAYVFRFLEPSSIVARIREQAVDTVEAAVTTHDAARAVASQGEVLAAMEELTDITSNSISGKDKIIASRAVDALKDFVVEYLSYKPRRRPRGSRSAPTIRDEPRLRRDGPREPRGPREAPDVGRVEGDAPVPRHLQRGARRHARHQLPGGDRHALRRRGGRGQGRSRGGAAGVPVHELVPARHHQRQGRCAPRTTSSTSTGSWSRR